MGSRGGRLPPPPSGCACHLPLAREDLKIAGRFVARGKSNVLVALAVAQASGSGCPSRCSVIICHPARNSAATTGPTTIPLNPQISIPPSVVTSTT